VCLGKDMRPTVSFTSADNAGFNVRSSWVFRKLSVTRSAPFRNTGHFWTLRVQFSTGLGLLVAAA